MNRFTCLTAVPFLAASVAQAHYGQRVWVDVDSAGKIVTLQGPPGDSPTAYAASQFSTSRVFTRDMGPLGDIAAGVDDGGDDDDGVNYASAFPGYQATPFKSTAFAGTFQLDIVGEVQYFDQATQRFVPVSRAFAGKTVPYFTVGDDSTFGASPSDGSIVPAGHAFTTGTHYHPENVLNYPGMGDAPDAYDGVYALGLRLRDGGYTPSDTYYLVLGKNAPLTELQQADGVARSTLVPEPTALAAVGLAGLLARRRRR